MKMYVEEIKAVRNLEERKCRVLLTAAWSMI